MDTMSSGTGEEGTVSRQAPRHEADDPPGSGPLPGVACDVCGYSPGIRIPDRCPVCLSHRDHFKRAP
jgi:rubrerythrin